MQDVLIQDKDYNKLNFFKEKFLKGEYENCTFINCNFAEKDLSGYEFLECKSLLFDKTL